MGQEHGEVVVRFEEIFERGVVFSGVVEWAFLQGVLRFPQVFWMVFCGEFVVSCW